MSISATVLADSISPAGHRLTTLEITFPRIVLAELNTHRMLSRNSASSRAIPVEKLLERVRRQPFVPARWGANQPGMQAGQEIAAAERDAAAQAWLAARDSAVARAEQLLGLGVHKQLANRLLEPFLFHTAIVSATEWSNFFALRCHPDAQPEIQALASAMRDALAASRPQPLPAGGWHLPLIQPDEQQLPERLRVLLSAARCARVSYLTHDGRRDRQADLDLYERLAAAGHLSPLEHPAQAMDAAQLAANPASGNFVGWLQHRKQLPCEADFGSRPGGA